jgi:hypothetical protein
VPVTLRNDGPMVWRAEGVLRIHLSYHWLSADGATYLVYEGLRTPLPHDVPSGESVTVQALVRAPATAGDYAIEWDLVQESVTWFSQKNRLDPEPQRVSVVGTVAADAPATSVPQPQPLDVEAIANSDTSSVSRAQLWRVALAMFEAHPLTGVGPDGFRNLYGKYAGVEQWNSNIYTNNTYIEMFTNLGLLGGLAFLWLAGLALWRAGRNLLREPLDAAWAAGLGVTAALVAFFLHGVADYFLFSTPMYTIFWFLLGVAVLWPRMAGRPADKPAGE